MIQVSTETKESGFINSCIFMPGVSTLVINDDSHEKLLAFDHKLSDVLVKNASINSIKIAKCPEPLLIDCQSGKDLNITIEQGVKAQIMLKTCLKNRVKLILENNASASFYVLGTEPHELNLVSEVAKDASLKLYELQFSNEQSRNLLDVLLLKERAQVEYFALNLLSGIAQKNTALTIFHNAQKTKSFQSFRGIYAGHSHGSFLGKVVVNQPASLSEASQLYRSVILNPKAKAHTMPQLEIYNHDITASHGASIGELDKASIFYLCSRGLSVTEARALLIEGLINDILDKIDVPAFKSYLSLEIKKALLRTLEEA